VLINGVDAKVTYGFAYERADGWLDAPARKTPSAAVLKRGGERALDNPRDQARSITIKGTVIGTSAQDARDKTDALKLALSKNTGAQITFDDLLTRFIIARCESFKVPPFGPSMIQRKLAVEIILVAYDPFTYSTGNTGPITLDGTTTVHQSIGTAPSRPIITLTGAQTNPVLVMWDTTGTVVLGTISLTVTMIAGDTLVIDCDAKTIKLNGNNRLDTLTSGDFFLFDPLVDTSPSLQYSSGGAGAGTGTYTWRKAWR
jgi:phage-related protein